MKDFVEFISKPNTTLINEFKDETTEPLYKKYFKGTKNLKNNFNDQEIKIANGSRHFKSGIGGSGYEEVFLTNKEKIFGCISPQISFIFPPGNRLAENRIGFRFYNSNPLESNKEISFFTLVKTYKRKFIILEKHSEIQDIDGKNFIDSNLDCADIICNILKNKYSNKKDDYELIYPYSIVELLGFCYALKEKKLNKFKIIDPYFPDEFDSSTKTETFNQNEEKIFLEPLLCNRHVSLLVFKIEKNLIRTNYNVDFSSNHFENLKKNHPIFKLDMFYNLFKFPTNNIQLGPSCTLWFVGTLLALIELDNQNSLDFSDNKKILIKIIKKIEFIMGINENETVINFTKIPNREKENISLNYFISYKIIFSYYIDVKNFLKVFYENHSNDLIDNLHYYQRKFYNIFKKIDNLNLNTIYYKLVSDNITIEENNINELKKKYYDAQKKFKNLLKFSLKIAKIESKNENKFDKLDYCFYNRIEYFKNYLEEILNDNSNSFIEFTREDFFNKLIDTNDIFLQFFYK